MNANSAAERFVAAAAHDQRRPLPIFEFDPRAYGLERWLGSLETAIMESIWTADRPCTVKRVWQDLKRTGATQAYTTVMTTMTRLWTKAMLNRAKYGLSYRYEVRETRTQFEERQIAVILASIEETE